MSAYLISNVRILDGTGREPFPGAVRVEAERIAAVTEGTPAPRGEGATVLHGAGATLMPGLIESHAHIGLADIGSHDLTRLPPEEHMLITVRNARTMLDSGYTSALSAAAPKPRLDVVLSREIEAGRLAGAPPPRQWPRDHRHRRTRRHQRAPPAALRDADLSRGSPTAPTRSAGRAACSPARASIFSSSTSRAISGRRAIPRTRRP